MTLTGAVIRLLTLSFGGVARARYREEWLADAADGSEIGIGRLRVIAGAARFALLSTAPVGTGPTSIYTRRDVRLVLACGLGSVAMMVPAGLVFLPALALAILGFVGVVVTAAAIMSRRTSRLGWVWSSVIAGVVFIASIITYWAFWGAAFDFADVGQPIPAAIATGSEFALITGEVAGAILVAVAIALQVGSGLLPKAPRTASAMDGQVR